MTLNSISSTYTMHKSLRSLTLLRKLCLTNELNETKGFIPFISQLQRRAFASSGRFDDQDYDDDSNATSTNRFTERSEEWDHDDAFMRKRTHMQRRGGRDFRPPQRNHRFSFREEDFDHQDGFDRRMQERSPLGSRLKTHDWNEATLGSFEKNFYVSHPSVSTRSQEEIDAFYERHDITVNSGERPTPVSHFQEANFPDPINHRLKATGWSEPTPIQSIGWPLALSGKNMVGVAQTGSGKTLGFLLPALVHIRHQRPVERGGAPLVVVLAPTRELAQQIQGVASQFCRPLGIRSCCVFGGQSKLVQARQLMKGQELVVATPGRLIDFVEDETICLGRTTYVVLDEADRMLDMGFEPQIRKILSQIRPDRQILMWTATWPEEIQSLAHDFLGDFTQINIGSTELTVNPNIKQAFRVCDERDKFHRLLKELRSLEEANDHGIEKTLIFTNTQAKAENIARKLKYNRFYAKEIHGRKSQSYRELVLDSFRSGRLKVLVATDVAARGLDVDDVKVVINYDLPTSIDDYIHRIGRTARASKSGSAVSFCTEDNGKIASDLVSTLQRSDQDVDPELKDLAILYNKYKKGGSARKFPSRYSRQGNYQSQYHRKGYGQQNMPWKGKHFY